MVAFLFTAIFVSQLSLTARRNAEKAIQGRIEQERLHIFGEALLPVDSSQVLASTTTESLLRIFGARGSALRFANSEVVHRAGPDGAAIRDELLLAASQSGTMTVDVQQELAIAPITSTDAPLGSLGTHGALLSTSTLGTIGHIVGLGLARVRTTEAILHLARDIQMGLLPKALPEFEGMARIDLFSYIKPTYDVGGDFYDFFPLDADRLFFSVGDVSDKGIPAALFMAVTITALKVSSANIPSLPEIMAAVNRHLCLNNASQMFVTVLAGIIDTRTGEIEYVDGGHEPPFVLARDGTVRMIEKVQGLALGFSQEFAFRAGRIVLNAGDALVVYTDGFNEAMNAQGAMFQTATIGAALAGGPGDSAEGVGRALIGRLEEFVGTAPQSDDRTLLVLRYRPDSPAGIPGH